ncbi:MAG: sulfate adenylyltransferase subunit CysN [Alphaproteobacteria bacterium]|nr:sulfate adenylyltransferase subunit CysN [Alphaproteobacteria bacterium]
MAHISELIEKDIHAYLKKQEEKSFLRFITCGSVDDGKSTLIGRLLWDSKMIFEDQLEALKEDSKKVGTQGENIDFALLLDGLQAEREQGITIDVAYRYFSTEKRKYIVADTPGHEQYTRNMATGASTADVAVILIDARKGVLTQTRRHSYIVSFAGIKKVILAVNKMDLVNYSKEVYEKIESDYRDFCSSLDFDEIESVPISALNGDNIIEHSYAMDWYHGTTLMGFLETVEVSKKTLENPFRMPVQLVNRPNLDFRGFCGTIESGKIAVGDEIVVSSSGQTSKVKNIITYDGNLEYAIAEQAITLLLEDEIDISRGDVLSETKLQPIYEDQFQAKIVWMNEEPLLPSRSYLIKFGSQTAFAQISDLKYKVNVNNLQHISAKTLELNEIGVCNVFVNRKVSFDAFSDNAGTGKFILVDKYSNATVGAGTIDFPLRRASNLHWQKIDVNKKAHSNIKGQKPCLLWFTGLSGAGKSTIANMVEKKLHLLGKHTYLLDGDNVRQGLNKDLGFTKADRVENIRRIAEVSKLFVDAGIITLAAFISPYRYERREIRELLDDGEFIEIFIDTPLSVCEERDVKGLYKKARTGELKNFTGIDSDYERPANPDIVVNGYSTTPESTAEKIIDELKNRGFLV